MCFDTPDRTGCQSDRDRRLYVFIRSPNVDNEETKKSIAELTPAQVRKFYEDLTRPEGMETFYEVVPQGEGCDRPP
jgi:hypothetical protein